MQRSGSTKNTLDTGSRTEINLNDHHRYVSITMEFRCNLRCVHCMIEGTMHRLKPSNDENFEAVLQIQREEKKWDGLILTGSEITLLRTLPDLAKKARHAGFKHIRIQTHGMHLSRVDYVNRLIDAGIDEFFISVAGHDAKTHDEITEVKGSFDRMMRGIEYLDSKNDPVKIITNTVVTRLSYRSLSEIVRLLAPYNAVVQNEFWNFFPMSEDDPKSLIVPYPELMPYINAAIEECYKLGKGIEVKNVPRCLLGPWKRALVNAQPTLHIDPEFWTEFDKNEFYQCPHRSACSALDCLGLTTAYIRNYGNEIALLKPLKQDELD
jgi:MoaA/NifB/PqqE/SkfB family radical SAM enzyme